LGARGKEIISQLDLLGIKPQWIADRDENLHGKTFNEIEIRPLSSLGNAGKRFVMLASGAYIREMSDLCKSYNIEKWILPAAIRDWCRIIFEFGICGTSQPMTAELISAYNLLSDEKSKDVFKTFVQWHYTFQNDFPKVYDPSLYFPNDLKPQIDYSCFIDVGAYIGDTLSDWISQCSASAKKYFAFEPDTDAFKKLNLFIDTLPQKTRSNIKAFNIALGNKNGFVNMSGADGAFSVQQSEKGERIACKRIDDLFLDEQPTIIKADVEGFEMDLLLGAEKTIRRCKPVLAVSVYHWYSDIWEIPLWINNLNCDYKIYLRHHREVFTDTVCYAIPKGALK
jgi:FkbM family methyltransferase